MSESVNQREASFEVGPKTDYHLGTVLYLVLPALWVRLFRKMREATFADNQEASSADVAYSLQPIGHTWRSEYHRFLILWIAACICLDAMILTPVLGGGLRKL